MRIRFPGLSKDSEVFYPAISPIYKETLYSLNIIGIYDCDSEYSVVRGPGGWPLDESCQLCLTLGGNAELIYMGKPYILNPGDLFLIDCRHPHSYRPGKAGTWQKLWFHFDGLNSVALVDFIVREHSPVMSLGLDSKVHESMKAMIDGIKAMGYVNEPLASGLIHKILTDLMAWKDPGEETLRDISMAKITAYIEMNLNNPISISALAKLACMSEGYFARRFKAVMGQTPYEYVLARRTDTACQLLVNTDLSVKAVTLETGFTNESRFIQAFKKRMGMTPQEYRRSITITNQLSSV